MKATEDQIRAEIVKCGKALGLRGYCPATSGNISVRLDPWRILITPTAVSKSEMQPDDLVVLSLKGEHRFGRKNASSEKDMHLQIYRLRPEVNAVVHAHPPMATAFACAGIPLDQPIASEFLMGVGTVPIAKYGTPGTQELAASLEALIPGHNAVLMGNHGVVAYGNSLQEAHGRMEMVEHFAEIVLGTLKIGRQVNLSPEELRKLDLATEKYVAGARKT